MRAEASLRAERTKMRLGAQVFVGLVLLDVVEYLVATTVQRTLVWLVLLALPQAWLIVRFYMHVRQLRGEED